MDVRCFMGVRRAQSNKWTHPERGNLFDEPVRAIKVKINGALDGGSKKYVYSI